MGFYRSVDNTQLTQNYLVILSHRHSTTVTLESYPPYIHLREKYHANHGIASSWFVQNGPGRFSTSKI